MLRLPLYSVLASRLNHPTLAIQTTWNIQKQPFILTTSNTTTTLSISHGLSSNHNPLPPPRKPQIRLRQTRRRPLQLARSLSTRLALSGRDKNLLATPRHFITIAEPAATKTPPNPDIRSCSYLLPVNNNNGQTKRLALASRNPPHNPKHDRHLNRTPHNSRRNAALSTLVSLPNLSPHPNPNPSNIPSKHEVLTISGISPNPKPAPAATPAQHTQAPSPSRRPSPKCANTGPD